MMTIKTAFLNYFSRYRLLATPLASSPPEMDIVSISGVGSQVRTSIFRWKMRDLPWPRRICPRILRIRGQILSTAIIYATIPSFVQADFAAGKRAFDAQYFDKARIEWSKSATGGDPESQFHLGKLFDEGIGVRENNTQAYFWYALSALGGSSDASAKLDLVKEEMSEQEIVHAEDLTRRFERVFAPIRYITSEPTSDSERPDATTAESTESTTEAVDNSVAAQNADEISESIETPDEATEAVETTAPDEASETAETTAPDETSETVETTEPDEATETVETTEPDEATETVESTEPDEATETVESAEPDEATETVENPDTTLDQDANTTEAIEEPVLTTGVVENAQEAAELTPPGLDEIQEASTETVSPVENRRVLSGTDDNANEHLKVRMRSLVREVQAMLNKLGYPAGPEDGVIGEKTRQAVTKFQQEAGLIESGEIGPRTIRALRARS